MSGINNDGIGLGNNASPNSADFYRININYNTILCKSNQAISLQSALAHNISVYSNYISGLNTGIQNQGANRVYINKNTIINGGISVLSNMFGGIPYLNTINTNILTGQGINLQNGYSQSIIGNSIKNILQKSNSFTTAIAVSSVSNLQLNWNAITNCPQAMNLNNIVDANIINNSLITNQGGILLGSGGSSSTFYRINIRYNTIQIKSNTCISLQLQTGIAHNINIYSNNLLGGGIQNSGAYDVDIRKNNIVINNPKSSGINIGSYGGPSLTAYSNSIYTNTLSGQGINVQGGYGYIIQGNTVKNIPNMPNQMSAAIIIQNLNNTKVKKNTIKNCSQGINTFEITNTDLVYNTINSNGQAIQLGANSLNINVKYNNLTYSTNHNGGNQSAGALQINVYYHMSSNNFRGNPPVATIRFNNFVSNVANINSDTNYFDVRTNWWGTSLTGAITPKFQVSFGGTPNFNYEPYRLWHQFNITEGADDFCLPSVTGFTSKFTNNNVNLTWNSTINAKHYYVYRAVSGDFGILNHALPYLRTTTTNTFFTDISPAKGIYYYWVNNGDNPGGGNILTNESWYGTSQAVTVGVGTNVWNQQKNKWYYSIQAAVLDASNNNKLIVMPYGYPVSGSKTYNEQVVLASPSLATNLRIVARDWTNTHTIDTYIDGTLNADGLAIAVYSNYSLEIHGFRIKNPTGANGGIGIANGSSRNYITHNIFYSNNGNTGSMGAPSMGIIIGAANCSNTIIATNQFYANIIDIGILAGHNIQIFSNTAHGAGFSSIALANVHGPVKNNIIQNNRIYSNAVSGASGIGLYSGASSNIVFNNVINNCQYGFDFDNPGGSGTPSYPGNSYNFIFKNNIYENGYGFIFQNNNAVGQRNLISHNSISNNMTGLTISSTNVYNNYIATNYFNGNGGAGISITSSGKSNSIYSNQILNSTNGILAFNANNLVVQRNIAKYNGHGINLIKVKNNSVYSNVILDSVNEGILLYLGCSNNLIYNNTVLSNKKYGIVLSQTNSNNPAANNLFYNNEVLNPNSKFGYIILGANSTRIYSTSSNYRVHFSTNGISVYNSHNTTISNLISENNNNGLIVYQSSNTLIQYNILRNNKYYGLYLTNAPNTKVQLNTISSNRYGIQFKYATNSILVMNNFINNTTNGRSPAGPGASAYTNNWWGTTVWSNIRMKFEGWPGTTAGFKPWRLFGLFNINPNADDIAPGIVTVLKATNSGPQILLAWNKIPNPGDFARYSIYRAANSGFSNLSRAINLVGQTTNISTTNFVDTPPSSAKWYYRITALDKGGNTIYTNESWYSSVVSASNLAGYVHNLNKNTWYTNISFAVAAASNNNTLECKVKPGNYKEQVSILSMTNLTIRAYDWVFSGSNTKEIIDAAGYPSAFKIQNSKAIKIYGFSIRHATQEGIVLTGSDVSNYFAYNRIYTNNNMRDMEFF